MARRACLCLVLVVLAGCGGPRPLVVASKNFTEQIVLGEIVAQHLENRLHQRVDRKLNLGGTMLVHQAMLRGQVDVYPEYTGTALTAVLKYPLQTDPKAVLTKVRTAYQPFGIEWLPPFGFNDSFAMVVRGDDARQKHITTLTSAAGPEWKLGVGYEFASRPDGLPALQKAYPQLRFSGSPVTMDLGLLYQALRTQQVRMVAGNTTDGALSRLDAVVLQDDRGAFPPYEACLLVRQASLAKEPRLKAALGELSGRIDEKTMRKLNDSVDREHRPVRVVAEEFLRTLPQPGK